MSRQITGQRVDKKYIAALEERSASRGYDTPKWVQFCKLMLPYCDRLHVYEAKTTVSKYITVVKGREAIKVRFSNHKPNKFKEATGDSDFFVGLTNWGCTKTEDAVAYVFDRLKLNVDL